MFRQNGQITKKRKLEVDKQNGLWEAYYLSGQFVAKGNVIERKRNGFWEFFKSDASILKAETD
jgi:antitoxin component YwqK of YwqJK toxin-antitoxin module